VGGLRSLAKSFVATGPSGVAVRTRLKCLTPQDEKVLPDPATDGTVPRRPE
jgi:hypothetical protein